MVRIVLPGDTVVRVAVDARTTAATVASMLSAGYPCDNNGGPAEQAFELVIVRSSTVLQEKQTLAELVQDGDILEWRPYASPPSHQQQSIHTEPFQQTNTRTVQPHRYRKRMISLGRRQSKYRPNQSQQPANRRHYLRRLLDRRTSSFGRHIALARHLPHDFVLEAAFECLDLHQSIQSLSRRLLVSVRDLHVRLGPHPIEEIYPVVEALAIATTELSEAPQPPPTERTTTASVRWLYPLLSRSLTHSELPIVIQGHVVVAEWVVLWRQQRSAYACLCDGAKLLFFLNKKQCDEYLLEQSLRGDGSTLDATQEIDHRRIIKENAPQTTIDLVASQWNVRKGGFANVAAVEASSRSRHGTSRHAFALFDSTGRMRLILDVMTSSEADKWVAAIKAEITRTERLSSVLEPWPSEQRLEPLGINSGGSWTLPLRWLHRHADSLSRGSVAHVPMKTLTLSQALKDARRDRFKINGVVYNGKCIQAIVGALLREVSTQTAEVSPMEALQFTRLLLLASSRTQGGGDILDAMRLVVGASHEDQYDFRPAESARMAPITIEVSVLDSEALVANILIQMAYRLHRRETTETLVSETTPAIELVGEYHRRLVCSADDWNRLDGSVDIQVIVDSHGR